MLLTQDEMHLLDISNVTISNWKRRKIADIGCRAQRTLRQFGADALFLSSDGVRSILQSSQDKKRGASLPLSHPIQDWIDRINPAHIHNSLAWVWADKYYLCVPVDAATTNSHIFVISRKAFESSGKRGGWSIYRNCGFNALGIQTFSGTRRLYAGESSADGKVYKFRSQDPTEEATNDNGTAIELSIKSRRSDFGFRRNDKTFQDIEVEAIAKSSGSLKIEIQIDGGGFSTVGNLALYAPTTKALRNR